MSAQTPSEMAIHGELDGNGNVIGCQHPDGGCGCEDLAYVAQGEQLDLLSPEPGWSRADGPATSKAAAEDLAARMRWGSQRWELLEAHGRFSLLGLTDEEAAQQTGLWEKRAVYWARCAELRRDGLIEVHDRTRATISGMEAMVCVITPLGRAVLDQMEERQMRKESGR